MHIEDFAQVFGVYPEDKYRRASARNIGAVIGAECRGDDIVEFIRRLTFNTLIGNADMHLKKWSLIYPDRRHAALAPAYDLVSTIAYLPDDSAALKFSRTRRFSEFSEDELAHLAARALLPEKLVLDAARENRRPVPPALARREAASAPCRRSRPGHRSAPPNDTHRLTTVCPNRNALGLAASAI